MTNRWMERAWFACVLAVFFGRSLYAQDGTVQRDGFDLHYRDVGTGTPVILLSGGPGIDVDYMSLVADFLPASYRRVFLEQRGTGRSKPPAVNAETMTLRLVVEDLEALRAHLKVDRLFLVGHSWGGMLAMAYAAAHPDRIDRMILLGSAGPTPRFRDWFGDNIRARMRPEDDAAVEYWSAAARKGVDEDKATFEIISAMTPAYFFDRAKGLAFAAAGTDGSIHTQVNRFLNAELEKGYDLGPGLRSVKRPVLIVQGHQDPIGDSTAEEIQRLIAGSQLRFVARAGHFVWMERPEEFRRIINEFLNP